MPVQTSYPGVYVQEQPSGVRTIVAVPTSVTAFVGQARQGPTAQPVRVFSVADYTRTFGAPLGAAQPMGKAVEHFFANGGGEALIVRVAGPTSVAASATLRDAAPADVLVLTAKGAGAWANRVGAVGLEAEVSYTDTSNASDLFTLVIRLRAQDPRTGESIVAAEERFSNLSMSPAAPRYARTVLLSSALVSVTGPAAALTSAVQATSVGSAAFNAPGTAIAVPTPDSKLRVSVNYGPPTDLTLFTGLAPGTTRTRTQVVDQINTALTAAGLPATCDVVANNIRITASLPGSINSAVTVSVAPSGDASQVLGLGLTWGGVETSGSASRRPVATGAAPARFTGGTDVAPTPAELVGAGGLLSLGTLDFPRFNLLCIPELPASDPVTDAAGLRSQALSLALSYCKQQRAFLIVDTPLGWPVAPPNVGGLAALGEHGAIYYPRLTVAESGPGGLPLTVDLPASGAVAGIMARVDGSRGVWKAPAGLTDAGIVGISGLSAVTDDNLSGQLNPRGVNVLRTFPGAGSVIWGARTLKGADSLASEHKYVPVRRLTDHIASSLYIGTQFAVFEPNDPDLWAQLRLAVTTFMRTLFRQGAFQQSPNKSESDSFFVACDESVNPQSEIDLGRVNVVVGFAPLKPAEFVVITITQISKLEA